MKKLGLIVAAAAMIATVSATVVSAKGWVQDGADWYYVDGSGEYVTDTIQSSGTNKFYLGEDGKMMKDYFLEDKDSQSYYFGSNGAMVTNTWVAIDSSIVENQGDYVPDTYWYYFQASGKAMKGTSGSPKKTTIDGKKVLFNEYGQMCTGWIDDSGKVINPDDETNPFQNALYYAGGDNDGVLRSGWVTYYDGYDSGEEWQNDKTNLYFYFNTQNNKKLGYGKAETKKINGKTYAFSDEGIMLSAWDVTDGNAAPANLAGKTTYFSGEDDGHQVKKGWVYAVPSLYVDTTAYNDSEEKYMYFGSSGEITADQFKKINGKYYAFNKTGIMKTGIVVWCPEGYEYIKDGKEGTCRATATQSTAHFVTTLDFDWANGDDFHKKGILRTDKDEDADWITVDPSGLILDYGASFYGVKRDDGKIANHGYARWELDDPTDPYGSSTLRDSLNGKSVKFHLFADDGARKTGANTVAFADDNYTFQSTASGDKGSGVFSKKYYSLGILLKASQDIRYGIYNQATFVNVTKITEGTESPAAGSGYDVSGSNKIWYGSPFMKQSLDVDGKVTDDLSKTAYAQNLEKQLYLVLTTAGSKQKGNKASKKDADGNYWLLDKTDGYLMGIFTQNVKYMDNKDFTSKKYSTSTYPTKLSGGLSALWTTFDFADKTTFDDAADIKSDATTPYTVTSAYDNVDTSKATYWTYTIEKYSGYWFQSDYGDKSNVWIPFGIYDNAGKTCSVTPTKGNDPRLHAYEVKPTNDYFLNCYWTD